MGSAKAPNTAGAVCGQAPEAVGGGEGLDKLHTTQEHETVKAAWPAAPRDRHEVKRRREAGYGNADTREAVVERAWS